MNITEAIRILNEAKDQGTQHIVFAFWESDMFERPDDEAWAEDAEFAMDNMDWSYTHDKIQEQLHQSEAFRGLPAPSAISVSSVVNHIQPT